jgi:sugar phosphate isomerase/epimerase
MRRVGGIGFHSSAFTDYSIEETVRLLSGLGYQAIELNMETAPHFRPHVTPEVPPARRREIREAIGAVGLTLSSLSAHINLIEADEQRRRANWDFVKGAIDLAVDLRTDIVHVISGAVPEGASEHQCWEWLVEGLRECVAYGRERGVKVAIEAAVFPGFLVWNLATLLRLLEQVGCDDLYVNFDPSHYLPAGDSVVEAFRLLRERIVHMHAKDAQGVREAFTFPPLGQGEVDWAGLAQAMAETEYEAHLFGYEKDPVSAAWRSKEFLNEVLSPWLAP